MKQFVITILALSVLSEYLVLLHKRELLFTSMIGQKGVFCPQQIFAAQPFQVVDYLAREVQLLLKGVMFA